MAHRLAPEKAQQWIALLAQRAEPLPAAAGMFAGDHPDVAGHRFPIGKPRRITQEDFGSQRCNRPDTWMRHQPLRLWSLPSQLIHPSIEFVDLFLQLSVQRQQCCSSLAGIRSEWQRFDGVLACLAPEGGSMPQTVIERDGL